MELPSEGTCLNCGGVIWGGGAPNPGEFPQHCRSCGHDNALEDYLYPKLKAVAEPSVDTTTRRGRRRG